MVTRLESSLSQALRHFFPLSGRLATAHHDNTTLSITIDCADQGAELIVAKSETDSATDVLACRTSLLKSLFPLNDVICHDGHVLPLLSIQLTVLVDSVFLAFSINHAVVDGTSFWHFINSWSKTSRSINISLPPLLDRWFSKHLSLPLPIPADDLRLQLRGYDRPPHVEAYFYFSNKTMAGVKERANAEAISTDIRISSLEALLAHLWMSVSRARKLLPQQATAYFLAIGSRGRLRPPLPAAYFGNSMLTVMATVFAWELAEKGLGWAAMQLNKAVEEHGDAEITKRLLYLSKNPTSFVHFNEFGGNNIFTGNSPRFRVFENDFGWGRPIAVRSGTTNKIDGMATVFSGRENDGMGIQLLLTDETMRSLLDDVQFIATTSSEVQEV